jgi:hypothetical protein
MEGKYEYQVRVHEADPSHGGTGSIFRVARREVMTDPSKQGKGWEYLGSNGTWYHTSVLKPGGNGGKQPNQNYNDAAARDTHIPVPKGY